MGERTVINEFIAFRASRAAEAALDPRSSASLRRGVREPLVGRDPVGGIGALIPERKATSRGSFRAMLAGTLASFMSGTIAGILL
jgi:CNT family concentrative nucleoside transporter